MIKLLDILLEALGEAKPVCLDRKSVLPQIENLYLKYKNIDEKKIESLKNGDLVDLGGVLFKSPYDPSFIGTDVMVFYDDDEFKDASALYDQGDKRVYINYYSKNNQSKSYFINTVYHELVHAIDPKTTKKGVKDKINTKNQEKDIKDKSNEYLKYLKRPEEFDAISTSFINQISDGLDNIESEVVKKEMKSFLKEFIQLLLTSQKEALKLYPNFERSQAIMFTLRNIIPVLDKSKISKFVKEVLDGDSALFEKFLYNIVFYFSKPSQFKKYIQRLSTLL
jgi:hypothetical protein